MNWLRSVLRTLFRPHHRPEIQAALKALDAKKEASAGLRDTMTELAKRF